MSIKVAVPVKDESLEIVTRTGRAPFFAIFEFDGNEFKLLGLNENTHAGEHEHEHGHQEEHTADEVEHHHKHVKASKVDDCDYIVVRALGPNMEDALKLAGVKIIKVSKKDGEKAPEVLEKVKEQLK
ncbi:NifB/NifX family molybdenum-iron cluster-binding protein [Caminibacter pacificus]|uniref:Dinitrogenase iron-molybdenum cofactor n=1 Tax=Caminibacter pacificus TaxID=1424653 RepID=A0AAJ4RC27_9BACT|nr:NifB/NifX family molybdenum-iron cluster-binding protein [Caminibacter pacificus]QCI28834.1 dinitrogenase iron-molybdenum cofactor [Caminibacter pacificus]ROR39421.1 putative Fe-Mo cluster-binding NifX family protein [Caminibacter pacificus]